MTAARTLQCPACGGTISVKAAGYTVNVACQYCSSVLDVANPDVKVIQEFHQAAGTLALPLGSRGYLSGIEWEAIGFLSRHDEESGWEEYLLFNPYGGYRWLIHDGEGGWSYGTMLPEAPRFTSGDQAVYRGESFTREIDPYWIETDRVVGEFYWRVRAGDRVTGNLYENYGNTSLSQEVSQDETSWTFVEELNPGVVQSSFKQPNGLPLAGGTPGGAAFASKYDSGETTPRGPLGELVKMLGLAAATFVACWIAMAMFGWSNKQIDQTIQVGLDAPARTFNLGTVTVTRPYQVVSINATSQQSFDNKWIDLDYSLVDRQTQQAVNAYKVVEHYSGYDSDGSWSEGSYSSTAKFAGVPRGVYDVTLEASAHTWSGSGTTTYASPSTWGSSETYNLRIAGGPGGFFGGNLALIALLLFVPIGWMIWRRIKGKG